ncbi:LCP family protein [Paenibacillus sanguinis]|uniref:LCP family protein n=1 Tax=Paenibacillus sanguinis TaxID=225906 RepID=UPI00035D531F|nr:LCP family protein [Paenibacillus sanguinis]
MKMKTCKKMIIPALALLTVAGGLLWAGLKYEPSRHFRNVEIPVLATPQPMKLPSVSGQGQDKLAPSPASASQAPSTKANRSTVTVEGVEENNYSSPGADSQAAQRSFNLLLLATDARAEEASRTDVLILVHVNSDHNRIQLISIPRDTRVHLPHVGWTKINHAHALAESKGQSSHAGSKSAIQAVSDLCRCTINYYVKTNFEGFEHFVNTIGGVDMNLEAPVKLTYYHKTLPKGQQHWDGTTTLQFVRERKSLEDGDHARQQNQVRVLKAIAKKILAPDNLRQLPTLLTLVKEDILDTNLTDADILSLGWLASQLDTEEIDYVQFPGRSGRAYDPLVQAELYYWIPDMEAWEKLAPKALGANSYE